MVSQMFHFNYQEKKRAPEPHYQMVIKITGYLLSLYLNSRHSNWDVIASKNKQTNKKAISPMQLINTEGMHSAYLEVSLALCSSCLNTPPLPAEVAESKHNLQTPDCLPHQTLPLADMLPCSDCCTGECTEKQVMKTLITTTQQ